MIEIDGSSGEGGGQVLRTSLALSLLTQTPFRIANIRAKRSKPGLLRQHLTAVHAAEKISGAVVRGASLGSSELEFRPAAIRAGHYEFSIGSAGSASLVLQTILLPLLSCDSPCEVIVHGGTHNSAAPPFEFLSETFAPALREMGASVQFELLRHGFFPAGGGTIRMRTSPRPQWQKFSRMETPTFQQVDGELLSSGLPTHVTEREKFVLMQRLGVVGGCLKLVSVTNPVGPGNAILLRACSGAHVEVLTSFGERRERAEDVAEKAALSYLTFVNSGVAVSEHLADQLLMPLCLGAGGEFLTGPLSGHFATQVDTLRMFLDVDIVTTEVSTSRQRVIVTSRR